MAVLIKATFGHSYARDYFVGDILRAASALVRFFLSCLHDGSRQKWLRSSIEKMDYNTVAAFNSILWTHFNRSKIEHIDSWNREIVENKLNGKYFSEFVEVPMPLGYCWDMLKEIMIQTVYMTSSYFFSHHPPSHHAITCRDIKYWSIREIQKDSITTCNKKGISTKKG